jgi:hypothetical protein
MNSTPLCLPFFLAGALLFGAGSQAPIQRKGKVPPIWVSALPQQAGRVYAVGMTSTGGASEAEALTEAAQNARAEVLARLRTDVRSETQVTTKATVTRQAGGAATGSAEQQVGQTTRIQTRATELPGLAVEETWIDAKAGSAYALASLDVPTAEREVQARFTAQKEDLFREPETPTGPRERMRMLSRLKKAQVELAKLDDMAALLAAGGGDPQLRAQIRAGKLAVDRQADQLRGSLTLSLEGAKGATAIAAILRNAALKAGLGWAEANGEFRLVMDYKSDAKTAKIDATHPNWNGYWRGGWVTHTTTKDTGIIVARGLLGITLTDRAGTQYESMEVEAKGLGVTNFQAEQKLKEDFREKLEKAFAQWLEHLVD